MAASRNFWQCPDPQCGYAVAWAMTGVARDDGDPGFIPLLHVRNHHPGWIDEGRGKTLEDILRGKLSHAAG